ncbi:short-chain dehydrogenase/reductase SDR [Hyaloraphidium curvatum]|nr:short-chain dehydrogenase/reductase SDR [Hyaloraphidium curvatum]
MWPFSSHPVPAPPKRVDLAGKLIVVTGANSGLGLESCKYFAANGATVVMAVRTPAKGEEAAKTIVSATGCDPARLVVMKLDLTSLESTRKFADELKALGKPIDVLMLNAGMMADKREVTADGFETTFQSNHLSHFLLANLLLPAMSSDGRIVVLSSALHFNGKIELDNLNYEKPNTFGLRVYADTKLQNALFGKELARRLKQKPALAGIVAHSCHPGLVATNFGNGTFGWLGAYFIRPLVWLVGRGPEQGAQCQIYLSVADEAGPGKPDGLYWDDCKVLPPKEPEWSDTELQRRFWEVSAKLAGLTETI